jgi:hypothetical protein
MIGGMGAYVGLLLTLGITARGRLVCLAKSTRTRIASRTLDSNFRCDTEVGGEYFDRRAVAEALPRRCVEVPNRVADVGVGVVCETGLAGKVAAESMESSAMVVPNKGPVVFERYGHR